MMVNKHEFDTVQEEIQPKAALESVLGVTISDNTYNQLIKDWRAFSIDPNTYKGTIVIDLIKHWLEDKEEISKMSVF